MEKDDRIRKALKDVLDFLASDEVVERLARLPAKEIESLLLAFRKAKTAEECLRWKMRKRRNA